MSVLNPATDLLLHILSEHPKEPAARLKQRLNTALIDKGLGPFDQKALGFKTFKDYLHSLGDLLSIEDRSGTDILVSLGQTSKTVAASEPVVAPPLKSEIWLAFTNPDPDRLRFYNKGTKRIEHFSASNSPSQTSSSKSNLVQISPISASRQSEWMQEFIAQNALEGNDLLTQIVATPYSSAVNAAFSRALGKFSVAWRKYRAIKVLEEAEAWAAGHDIDPAALRDLPEAPPASSSPSMSPRTRATKLLDSFSDQELIETVIPILAASALVKSRL